MTTRLEYYRQLSNTLSDVCKKVIDQHPSHSEESNSELLALCADLDASFINQGDYAVIGQSIVTRIISHYPDITPQIHRDLLWFFGGDCLHYLGDEEIQKYQEIEERYYDLSEVQGEDKSCYRNLRAQVFNMH
ncbi:PA2817 family protein [Zhongshania sp. BJYM1]|uniref:PA2817 family protein n=1 Tax=Zhongshania aquatica TaxID=2965069 RepID=UPI0022B34187|nr:PA2817 family protein [Marortus sp. BJYM1]